MTIAAITADTLASSEMDAPLWREAVVGASIAAMAAATGLAVYNEVGADPWFAIASGTSAALILWGMHRRLNKRQPPPQLERKLKSAPRVAAPQRSVAPATTSASPRPAAPIAAVATAPALAPATKTATGPELSAFTPRAAAPAVVLTVATDSALPTLPPELMIEAQFAHLQGLVKQLAAEVAGPKATTPDPDRLPVQAAHSRTQTTPPRTGAGQTYAATGFTIASDRAASPLGLRLAEAVAAERMDVMLEPIQGLNEQKARHFEVSVRFRDAANTILPAAEVASIARATGLGATIDALKLPRVAKVAQRVQSRGGAPADVLANLAGTSLADPAFMDSLANAFNKGATGAVVLSFAQADVRAFARVHWSALSALADMGLRFALSDVTDLEMDFDLLRARSFVFAKLDAGVFLNGLPLGAGVIPASDIRRHIAQAGLDLIVDRIDDETQLGRLLELGVVYGQGILFGGARPVRQDILH